MSNIFDKYDSNSRVAVILSGGLDSTILTYCLVNKFGQNNVLAITFNYNQRHSIEIEKAKTTCKKLGIEHTIIDIEFFGDLISPVSALSNKKLVEVPHIKDVLGLPQPVSYVPYRNMLFLTLGLSICESLKYDYLFIGVQSSDLYGYWDTTPEFIKRMNSVSQLNRDKQILIENPFNSLLKEDEIKIGIGLNVSFEDTWSCYNGDIDGACATCATCAERIKAFMNCNIKDPIPYKKEIPWRE